MNFQHSSEPLQLEPPPKSIELGPPRSFAEGTVVFCQGAPVRDLHLIHSGIIVLMRIEEAGGSVIVGFRSRGWLLGAAAGVLGLPHPVTATTLTACELHLLRTTHLNGLPEPSPGLSTWLLRQHARESYEQTATLGSFGALRASERLERLLVQLVRGLRRSPADGSIRLPAAFRTEVLAKAIGATREHTSRLLGLLEKQGEISREKGWIIVRPASRLLESS